MYTTGGAPDPVEKFSHAEIEYSLKWIASNPALFDKSFNEFVAQCNRNGWSLTSKTTSGFMTLIGTLPESPAQSTMPGEWIEWNGGECPAKPGTMVDVLFRSGIKYDYEIADDWCWVHDDATSDIVKYRIASTDAENV